MPNESWRYVRAEGDLLFHFSAWLRPKRRRRPLRLPAGPERPRPARRRGRAQRPAASVSPVAVTGVQPDAQLGSLRLRQRRRRGSGTSGRPASRWARRQTLYELRFSRRLGAVADLIAVGRSAGGSLAHLVFGIAAPGTSSRRDRGRGAVSCARSAGGPRCPRPLRRHPGYDPGHRHCPCAEPGRSTWSDGSSCTLPARPLALPGGHAAGRQRRRGAPAGSVDWRRPTGAVPPLSDIALGARRASRSLGDRRGGHRPAGAVGALPGRAQRSRSTMRSVAPDRAGYRHEISVLALAMRPEANGVRWCRLSFEEVAAGEVIRSRRTVRLDAAQAGQLRRRGEGDWS